MLKFNPTKMIEATKKDPFWIHFGAGNIFRAFPAALQQKLLDCGYSKRGTIDKKVIVSIAEKVYSLVDENGKFLINIVNDFVNRPKNIQNYIGKIAKLCLQRYKCRAYPTAMVSMDNC